MPTDVRQRARPVFMEVADLSGDERKAALARLCGDDEALLAEVAALLSASDSAGAFLGEPATAPDPGEHAGQTVGRYRLLQSLGSGGFGSVWMAEQREPVKRRVALKIIKLGMDTRQVIARFEAERQALAMMDHPNIARVLDAGATDTGRPFFVMEYIKGVPLMEYCNAERLTVRDRLDLFTRVCNAIQHAHQKGVIHRDIKPGNVLVTMHDGVPIPKVIDFGIAKATGAELTQRTLFTEHRQLIGTPAYMSPEQAEMSGLDVDTRSDIYSLGVLLYELLTGTTPFDSRELLSKGLAEMARVLREVEPVRPSTRLSTLNMTAGANAGTTSAPRATDPRQRAIHGDLDWIVMKCLEKDRNRRYDSASALAADIQRHLADEPVSAGPPTAAYRLRKFARRHKSRVIAACLITAALLLGTVSTSIGLVYAVRAADAERTAKLEADKKRAEAETNLAFARRGNEILGSVFASLDPNAGYATAGELRNALRENLDKAVKEIDGASIGDPLEVAAMQHRLGISLLQLGDADRALNVLERAAATREAKLGESAPDTLRTRSALASAFANAGHTDKAQSLAERLQPLYLQTFGADHPETLTSMYGLAYLYATNRAVDRAVQLADKATQLAEASTRPEKIDPLTQTQSRALIYELAGKNDQALPLYEQAARLAIERYGRTHPTTLIAVTNLATSRSKAGDTANAISLYEETLAVQRERLGRDHPSTLMTMGNLAIVYQQAGKHDLAAQLYEETYKLRQVKLGPTHPQTIGALSHLADAYWNAGGDKRDEALKMYADIVTLNRQRFGPAHPDTVNGMIRLADARLNNNDPKGAAEEFARVIELKRLDPGPDHPDTLCISVRYGAALLQQGATDRAESVLTAAYNGLSAQAATLTSSQRDHMARAVERLIDLYTAAGNTSAAEQWKARRPH